MRASVLVRDGVRQSRTGDSTPSRLVLGNDLGTLIDGRARFPFAALPVTRSALLLRPAADREQKLDLGLFPPANARKAR